VTQADSGAGDIALLFGVRPPTRAALLFGVHPVNRAFRCYRCRNAGSQRTVIWCTPAA